MSLVLDLSSPRERHRIVTTFSLRRGSSEVLRGQEGVVESLRGGRERARAALIGKAVYL